MEISKLSSKKMVSVAYERLLFNDLTGENYSVLIGDSVWKVVSHEGFFPLCFRFLLLTGVINLTSSVVELLKAFSDATTLRNYIWFLDLRRFRCGHLACDSPIRRWVLLKWPIRGGFARRCARGTFSGFGYLKG